MQSKNFNKKGILKEKVSLKTENNPSKASSISRKYEGLFIFHPELDEDNLEKAINVVEKFITSNKGKLEEAQKMGMRKIPHPIKKQEQGQYLVFKFQSSSDLVDKMKKEFKLEEKILRCTVIRK